MDPLRHRVQAGHVDLRALLYALYLLRCLQKTPVRHNMPGKLVFPDPVVHSHVACLILLSAAAPARVIALDLFKHTLQCQNNASIRLLSILYYIYDLQQTVKKKIPEKRIFTARKRATG